MKKLIAVALLSLSFAFVGVGCTTDNTNPDNNRQQPNSSDGKNAITPDMAKKIEEAEKKFVVNYANIALASYKDSLEGAKKLKTAIDALVKETAKDTPDPAAAKGLLEKAKTAWLESREPYLQTEIFRFYDGPINMNVKFEGGKFVEAEDGGDELEPLINAWPLDEKYIDYVMKEDMSGVDDAGFANSIIGNESIALTKDGLVGLNEEGGEANISVGYHALEFMLWGQDLYDDSPGKREVSDYIGTTADEKKFAKRRREYIAVVADILVEHLTFIVDQWKDVAGSYRAKFLAKPKESTVKATNALRLLAGFETGGERIAQALVSQDQEDEHSCFSDNTHRDMIQDIQGMLNVYFGTYKTVGGKTVGNKDEGLKSVFAARDAALAKTIGEQLTQAHKDAVAMEASGQPFDQMIDKKKANLYALVKKVYISLNQNAEASIFKMQALLNYEIECEKEEVKGKFEGGETIHAKKDVCKEKN